MTQTNQRKIAVIDAASAWAEAVRLLGPESARPFRANFMMALDDALTADRAATGLSPAERERVLWWLHQPVEPGPLKTLDETIIRKLTTIWEQEC